MIPRERRKAWCARSIDFRWQHLLVLCSAFVLPGASQAQLPAPHVSGPSGSLDEFDNLIVHRSAATDRTRLFLGDVHGFLHVYERLGDAFEETWISEYYEGRIGGMVFTDINSDGLDEIVLYTESGRLYYIDLEDYTTIWENPQDEYESIRSMHVHNADDDAGEELILVADDRLVIYDGRLHFEQWRSEEHIEATDIVIGDVDGDDDAEIVLNDGHIYDIRHLRLEWKYNQSLGVRMGLLDLDNDGIVEVIGEFGDRHLRIFDVDERRMKNIRR